MPPLTRPSIEETASILSHACGVATITDLALRLGVLDHLRAAPATAHETARALSLDEHGVAALFRALDCLGVLESLAQEASPLLRYRVRFANVDMRHHWSALEERIRHGRPRARFDTPEGAGRYYPIAVNSLGRQMAGPAQRAAAVIAAKGLSILDLGAGAAPWSRAIAQREPGCRVTAVDLPEVLTVTRQRVADSGLTCFEYRAGDLFELDFGHAQYDLVILGMFCHLFDVPTNQQLIARVHAALRPGGNIAILDTLPSDGADALATALYDLDLSLRTRGGMLYSLSTYSEWLGQAGFGAAACTDLGEQVSLVLASRESASPQPEGLS